jgi:hypothetical protein
MSSRSFSLKGDNGAITVKVLGYENPQAKDVSDANWLKAEIAFNSGGCTFCYSAALTANDIKHFQAELESVFSNLEGSASFLTDEEAILLRVEISKVGSIKVAGELKEVGVAKTKVAFEFCTDQSFLGDTCSELRELLNQYPVIEKS